MYCGTCLHDNTLAAALIKKGHQVALIPTYTPIRTDEEDVSMNQIFYGGINVYLQQKSNFFRHTHKLLDRMLDSPALLNRLSNLSSSTDAADLGELTVSVMKGSDGNQKKELEKLVDWLQSEYRPDVIHLNNCMFVGMVPELKKRLNVPVVCSLSGEDLFLEGLKEPYKKEAMKLLQQRAQEVDGFIAPSSYYAQFMTDYLNVEKQKMHVVALGLILKDMVKDTSIQLEIHLFLVILRGFVRKKDLMVPLKRFNFLQKIWHEIKSAFIPQEIFSKKIWDFFKDRETNK